MKLFFSIFFCFISISFSKTSLGLDTLAPNQYLTDNQTLVSTGEAFILGFFCPWNSSNRYVGIWYKNNQQTVVWVANKNSPITDSSGVLTLTPTGNIVIANNQSDIAIWSSKSSANNPVLQLLNTGNLVLKDSNDESYAYSWQSFDHPCDTLLPDMKLGWNLRTKQNWFLTSWKSLQDPSTGEFTYRVDPRGLPQLVLRRGTEIEFRSGPWDGIRFGGDPQLEGTPVLNPIFVYNTSYVYYTFENSDSSTISRFVVNQSGFIDILKWNLQRGEWSNIYTMQKDECDKYGHCGPNGICDLNKSPVCQCPTGFTPKTQEDWNLMEWSGGCIRKMPLNCSAKVGFRKFSGLKLPDTSELFVNSAMMSLEECEAACLRNCSCTACAKTEASGCVAWFGNLLDIRVHNGVGEDLYIRMAASELESKNKDQRTVVIMSVSVVFGVLLLVSISWLLIWKRTFHRSKAQRQRIHNPKQDDKSSIVEEEEDLELPLFDTNTIATATNNFSFTNKIGEGGFGPVYKGELPSGEKIAVKRLSRYSGQGLKEFKNEVILIAKLQHRNLVKLLGCCIHAEDRMLIYEFMSNRSLELYIFNQTRGTALDWQKRFDIIVGIARGLLYLHRDSRLRIIHRDLKASNILLDSEMNPKISDFGLARTFGGDQTEANTSRIIGTYGYMSPEYAIDGLFSVKSDVFSFGVLVLEIVSGKKNRGFYHPDHDFNLLGHAWKLWNENRAMELMDALMEKPIPESEVLRCIQVSLLCVQQHPEDRPPIASVLLMLDSENSSLTQPKQPGFYTERSITETDSSLSGKTPYTATELTITMLQVDTITPNQSIVDGQELVSSRESFVLGFFSPGNSKKRYLGIWFKNINPLTIVWVANRENPLNDSYGHLSIGADGNIVLLDGAENTIWSSKSSREMKVSIAKLLDSGNLVLMDESDGNTDSYIWQSFEYPADTLLPGMKLGWDVKTGLHLFLTSWKSADDPSPGNFSYGIGLGGLPQIVILEGSLIKFRSGIWNGVHFNSQNWNPSTAFKAYFIVNIDRVSYMYENGKNTTITRLLLDQNGFVQRYVWNDQTHRWYATYEARKDLCDNYGFCGPNSICKINGMPSLCECIKGFIPKSQQDWDAFNWADGCIRKTQLNCTEGDRFLELKGVKLPNLLQFWINKNMNLKECEVECLKNCSCAAYANSNVSGGAHGCLLWFGDLVDIRIPINEVGGNEVQNLFVMLAASEIESIAGRRSKKRKLFIMVLMISVGSGVLLLGSIICFVIKKEKNQKTPLAGSCIQNVDPELPLFDLGTVVAATDNFSSENKIGEGGFGPVYKGKLAEGQEIAVKRLSKTSKQGTFEFKNEVILVAKLQHRNLVRVFGGCIQGEERMLIYEYMSNKSLDQFIFDPRQSKFLNWRKRLKIIMGIARGLLYLHQDSRVTIIHRDLKSSNILLDSEMNPKIADFGMAHIFEGDQSEAKTKQIAGTYGYMSPEYAINGCFSVKSDVFSFGVIVIEILSGLKIRKFCHPDCHHNLLGHAWILWKDGRPLELMDVNLDTSYVSSELLRCMQVGLLCVQKAPVDRPTMSSVIFMLGNEGVTLPQPKEPGFFTEESSNHCTVEAHCCSNAVTFTSMEAR
ncbi:receptor-like serine/threonine-protein kinase SD1-8 isoform X2 [Quercus lobata]|uniref:receptor-like serine/threonine-protein kinase SD1-8 isoform X2 n=1 Tax=Quercus lobata TaxID=97700 RepID=UPI0012450441|nr:receptor-like serine/threonine-protein kinase SD1-8 isoform X2 [Quercus lobata]